MVDLIYTFVITSGCLICSKSEAGDKNLRMVAFPAQSNAKDFGNFGGNRFAASDGENRYFFAPVGSPYRTFMSKMGVSGGSISLRRY